MDQYEVNEEDLNELEVRLYSQLHYGYASETDDTQKKKADEEYWESSGTNTGVRKRYWRNPASMVYRKQLVPSTSTNVNPKNMNTGMATVAETPTTVFSTPTQKIVRKESRKSKAQNSSLASSNHKIVKNPVILKPLPPKLLKEEPFAKRAQKLEKLLHYRDKKKKAKKARAKAKLRLTETIILDSSSDEATKSDDVIIVPEPPLLTINVDTSDEESNHEIDETAIIRKDISESIGNEALAIDENAVDFHNMSEDLSFARPQTVVEMPQAVTLQGKRTDTISRCTSPCSVQSTDDFIGVNDRKRLKQQADFAADDEDLLHLTADVNSTNEKSPTSTIAQTANAENKNNETHTNNFLEEFNCEGVESTGVEKPYQEKAKYNVDQSQLRAFDVYESESDITEGVYSKGTQNEKPTIIRLLSSSSDENSIEADVITNHAGSKLHQFRISGNTKELEQNNENENTSILNEDSHKRKRFNSTGISFISRGMAVEHYGRKLQSPMKRRASLSIGSAGHMSDNEFISTLQNLAQGDNEIINESDGESETENAPTARDIAENVIKSCDQTLEASAIPPQALQHMDTLFETIDNLNEPLDHTMSPAANNAVTTLSSTDSNDSHIEAVQDTTSVTSVHSEPTSKVSDPVYNIVYSRGNNFNGGIGWSEEMRRFYNDSWNGETFNLREIFQRLDHNKKLWKIYTEDRFPKERRHTNVKCSNCCEFGHTRGKCKRPKKPSICFMCGEHDHYEPRCPNTLCLRCGNKTRVFTKSCNSCVFQNRLICPLCKVRGHSLNYCPDKWRRYHSTTEPNAYPNNDFEYSTRKYCCICGRRGHLSETCKSAVRFMEYPVIVSNIKSHQKSYNDEVVNSQHIGIACNLLYQPLNEYFFNLAENTMKDKCYGRFLNAVGMGYLLNRKRRLSVINDQTSDNDVHKAKRLAKTYTPNPQASVSKTNKTLLSTEPEQVQEISISGIHDGDCEDSSNTDANNDGDKRTLHINTSEENENNLTINEEVRLNRIITSSAAEQNNRNQAKFKTPIRSTRNISVDRVVHIDSDSNYSFSEHFDEPENEIENSNTCEEEPLPDFIPLSNNSDVNAKTATNDDLTLPTGLSHRFVTADSDDEDNERSCSPLPDLPCEAKIYLSHFHSKYLLSPVGQKFLVDKSKEFNIQARLDFTSVGHVLVIFGLQINQDKFHRELLLKYRDLTDQMHSKRSVENLQKVPKRIDVLIRFLRDNINQLLSNLGNVNDLLKKLQQVEQQQALSKAGFKSAEKLRRSLNMILLGQAGLLDGSRHLDNLLINLKTLINDFKSDDHAPVELRNEIDAHWKLIFTSYRHDDYPKLVQAYNRLVFKNRLPKLNIDPVLLGNKIVDTSLSAEQRENLQKSNASLKPTIKALDKKQSIPSTINTLIQSSPPPPAPSMKISTPFTGEKAAISKTNMHNTNLPTKTFLNNNNTPTSTAFLKQASSNNKQSQQKAQSVNNVASNLKDNSTVWETTCGNLLSEIDSTSPNFNKNIPKTKSTVRVSKGPSMFWSRESIKYLDECINLAECNAQLLEKLQRIQSKSLSGQLSYNDYRAVIRLHSTMLGK